MSRKANIWWGLCCEKTVIKLKFIVALNGSCEKIMPVINPITLADQAWVVGRQQWTEKLRKDNTWVPVVNNGYAIFLSKMSEQQRKEYWKSLLDDIPPISAVQILKDDPAVITALEIQLSNALYDGNAQLPMKDVTPSRIELPRPAKGLGRAKSQPDKN